MTERQRAGKIDAGTRKTTQTMVEQTAVEEWTEKGRRRRTRMSFGRHGDSAAGTVHPATCTYPSVVR